MPPPPAERGGGLGWGATLDAISESALRRLALGRSRLALGIGGGLGQDLEQAGADVGEAVLALDLEAEDVLHIEDVDDALAVCGDLRGRDLQVELGQRARDLEEEAGPVAAVDLDQRM